MSNLNYYFTSESVSEGHPDKVCDQISDAVLDAHLKQDPNARVACETLVKTGLVVLAGEITSSAKNVDYQDIVRGVLNDIGYDHSDKGFDGNTCGIMVALERQSLDINRGVDKNPQDAAEQGAGDQGMMFGYACDETDVLMPMSLHYSHLLLQKYAELRKSGDLSWAYPDAKSQVTIQYIDGKPARISAVVLSAHHAKLNASRDDSVAEKIEMDAIRKEVETKIIRTVLPAELLDAKTHIHINPTGRFETGGPVGDAGLTGRKIIVDTYGGHGAHGGGAFSGKDPSKVDRSAAYLGRYIAKNLVAAGMAKRCLVQLAYAIGVAKPVSVMVDTDGTGTHSDEALSACVEEVFDSRPGVFTSQLKLNRPIYKQTAAYGHFGRELEDFTWERTDKVDAINAFFAGK